MPQRTIKEQVNAALSKESTHTAAAEYLKAIRENMRTTEDEFIKVGKTLLVAAVGFEFLARAAISEASVGGFKFTDLSLVQKFLPVIIAYLTYWMHSLIARRRLLREVHDTFIEKLHPEFYSNNLEFYSEPPSPFNTQILIFRNTEGLYSSLMDNLLVPFIIVITFGPVLFEVYAFYRCFLTFGWDSVVIWSALVISLLFLTQSVLFLLGINKLAPRVN